MTAEQRAFYAQVRDQQVLSLPRPPPDPEIKRAEIENFRWHDLRHTWASWHIQNGTPLHALQELGGWSESEMVQRYAHLSPLHLSAYANNVSVETETEGTNWLYSQKIPANDNRRRA